MAWLDAFRGLTHDGALSQDKVLTPEETFESLLLRDRLPFVANGQSLSPSLIERASGVLAARLPARLSKGQKTRLIFVLPNATQGPGRFLAVSLLLADFVKRQNTNGPLLYGDLLLITQHIRDCVNVLRDVSLRSRSENLAISQFWPIQVLSQYTAPTDSKPRVFVANPGWSSVFGNRRPFGSVVIDVSHPRTADHLESLLKQPSITSAAVQILVIPPWEREKIDDLCEKDRQSDLIWAWDPAAVEAIEQLLATKTVLMPTMPAERFVWLSDDVEVEDQLANLHSLLVGALKMGRGRLPAGVLGAWATYHKLRQLCVPLVTLEEERTNAYETLTIQERIQVLENEPPEATGAVGAYLDARWPCVISAFKTLYHTLLRRKEPAKFYTLAMVIDEFLNKRLPSDTLRIIAPTAHEGNMLAALLGDIVNAWPDALQSGAVSLSTVKKEPRLIAEGSIQPTVLLGFRTSETRYLDVYPRVPFHVVAYPYEAEIDARIQQRIYASIENLQDNAPRTVVLRQLHFSLPSSTNAEDKKR